MSITVHSPQTNAYWLELYQLREEEEEEEEENWRSETIRERVDNKGFYKRIPPPTQLL